MTLYLAGWAVCFAFLLLGANSTRDFLYALTYALFWPIGLTILLSITLLALLRKPQRS